MSDFSRAGTGFSRGPRKGRDSDAGAGATPIRPRDTLNRMSAADGVTWVDTREAAGLLGVTPEGIARLVDAGRLARHTKPGCFPFFSRREVAALAEALRIEGEGS